MSNFTRDESKYRQSIEEAFKQINNDNLEGAEASLCDAATMAMIYDDDDRYWGDVDEAPNWPERARRLISVRNFIRDYREFMDGPK